MALSSAEQKKIEAAKYDFTNAIPLKILVLGDKFPTRNHFKTIINSRTDYEKKNDDMKSDRNACHFNMLKKNNGTRPDEKYRIHLVDNINDTQGTVSNLDYKDAKVAILCFDCANRKTFENILNKWFVEVKSCLPTTSLMLCGFNKQKSKPHNPDHVHRVDALELQERITTKSYDEDDGLPGFNMVYNAIDLVYEEENKEQNKCDNTNAISFKILLIGDACIGKRKALIDEMEQRSVNEKKDDRVIPNMNIYEYNCYRAVSTNGKSDASLKEKYKVTVVHNCGKEHLKNISSLLYKDTNVVAYCFSFIDRNSLENIQNVWHKKVKKYLPDAATMLVGFKKDPSKRRDPNYVTLDEVDELKTAIKARRLIYQDTQFLKLTFECIALYNEIGPRKRTILSEIRSHASGMVTTAQEDVRKLVDLSKGIVAPLGATSSKSCIVSDNALPKCEPKRRNSLTNIANTIRKAMTPSTSAVPEETEEAHGNQINVIAKQANAEETKQGRVNGPPIKRKSLLDIIKKGR